MKLKSLLGLLLVPSFLAAQQSGYVTVSDGARLYYRTSGKPSADTIIAIHGGPGLDLGTIYNDMAVMFGDPLVLYTHLTIAKATLCSPKLKDLKETR